MSWEYYEYVPVAEKKKKAQKTLERLRKKDPDISPVVIEGRKLAKTWWGIAWNKNLEGYADYENRLGRGSSYVKNGMVLDLRIEKGRVRALVMGSQKDPYQVEITIDPLPPEKWRRIVEGCSHRIGSMAELAAGSFPQELGELFLRRGEGLFPSPREIHLDCSCYDWADMCKHVAAALYGIGARLDQDPTLFFRLRDVPIEELLRKSAQEKMESLLKNAGQKTARVLENADLAALFGIDGELEG